jgi:hypothetical protein
VGAVDVVQKNGRPRRGQSQDVRAGTVLRETDERSFDGHDAAERQSGEVQADAEPSGLVARQVRVANGPDSRGGQRMGAPADRRDLAVFADFGADDGVGAANRLQLGRGRVHTEPRFLHRVRVLHPRLRDLGEGRQNQSRPSRAERQQHRHGQGGAGGHERAGSVRGARGALQHHTRAGGRGPKVPSCPASNLIFPSGEFLFKIDVSVDAPERVQLQRNRQRTFVRRQFPSFRGGRPRPAPVHQRPDHREAARALWLQEIPEGRLQDPQRGKVTERTRHVLINVSRTPGGSTTSRGSCGCSRTSNASGRCSFAT